MKREIANIRVEIVSESPEARDYLLETMVERINKEAPSVYFKDAGNVRTAGVKRAKLSRVRKA